MCSELGGWFNRRGAQGLLLRPAAEHPNRLTRITYISATGRTVSGVRAIAHAFNHINLAYAWLGWLIALPLVAETIQLLNDVVGGNEQGDEQRTTTEVGVK